MSETIDIAAREARQANKRAANPESLKIPGKGDNRALRRLAKKTKTHLVILQLMQMAGRVAPNQRRITKEKIAGFVAALRRSAVKTTPKAEELNA